MPRGIALSVLRQKFKALCSLELDEDISSSEDEKINLLLALEQEWLRGQHGFLLGKGRADIALVAGQRFYDFPETSLDIDRVDPQVVVQLGTEPLRRRVEFGIGPEQYEVWDSTQAEQMDWVRRWDLVQHATDGLQVEVWPIPQTSTQTLEFTGIKPLAALTQDTDLSDLDDLLIVLFAAAKYKARRGDSDATAILNQAQAHLNSLKGSRQSGYERFSMSGGNGEFTRRCKARPIVGVSNV